MTNQWTTKEIQFLKDNYKDMSIVELAAKLGRPYGGVSQKLQQLKLRKVKER